MVSCGCTFVGKHSFSSIRLWHCLFLFLFLWYIPSLFVYVHLLVPTNFRLNHLDFFWLYMQSGLQRLKDFPQPFWLALFVEGTRFTQAKLLAAQEYAASTGLPIPRNVLIPRTKVHTFFFLFIYTFFNGTCRNIISHPYILSGYKEGALVAVPFICFIIIYFNFLSWNLHIQTNWTVLL